MKPFRLSRRAVLRGAGGITVALPLLDLMRPAGRLAQLSRISGRRLELVVA